MVKQGPCCHCGITSTPLWRNGPPGKPVLCNACGSRWRTKGTLANYAPLHSRFFPSIGANDHKSYRESNILPKKKTNDLYKVNFPEYATEVAETTPEHSQYDGDFNDGVNNNSSSGSETSISESCIQYGNLGGNDISGPVQSNFWHPHIPSRKRTSKKHQSPSPIEKLRRDLCDLQQQQSSYPSGSIEDLLFLEKEEDPTLSMETGLGGFPIKKPRPSVEEESVTSSFAAENKISSLNDVSMGSSSLDMHSQSDEISSSSAYSLRLTWDADKPRKLKGNMPKHHDLANIKSESSFHSNPHVLQNIHSLLPPKEMMVMTDERTSWEKERSPSSSHVIGARTLLQSNGSPNLTDCQTSGEASLEAQDHDTVHLHPAKVSLKTDVDSGSWSSFTESSDQPLMTCSNANAVAPTSSPNRISTNPASVKDDPVGILDKNFFIISPPHLSFYPPEFSYFKSHNKDQV